MRVIELDGDFFRKRRPIGVAPPEAPYEIGQRAGDEKILLHESQSLPLTGGVVRIEHSREGLGRKRLGQRPDKVAAAEPVKVEVIWRCRGPEAKCVDRLAAI